MDDENSSDQIMRSSESSSSLSHQLSEVKRLKPGPKGKARGTSLIKQRIKLDYGWKTLLRGMRQCLRDKMEGSSMFTGRHHWNDSKLFRITKIFIVKEFGLQNPSDYETWALVLLLNPAKGITESKKKDKYKKPACEELYNTLKDDGLEIFRDIFSNNNR
jgi:hypothetical protein